ncbi:MAG: competence/damage-inducible protein A [Bacteroidota bacterium]|nr:competence/damage-inducible protein A [Bacteroidota bacterium]
MLAEIITIGDELLIGQVLDTNSAWLGQQLSLNGIRVKQMTSVSDDPAHIVAALDEAKKRADIILITGGLGPTKDDLTKKTLKDYFKMEWRTDAQILEDVIEIFKRFGKETTEINKLQAQVPDGCIALRNKNGTAPGMWFESDKKIFVSMPGVPYEMKGIVTDSVLPMLREKFGLPTIIHKTILTQGIGESALAEKIEAWEDSLAADKIKLAYLPSPGIVRLRLSVEGDDKEMLFKTVDKKLKEVMPLIESFVFGFDDDKLEKIIGDLLKKEKKTLSTAESCTGGLVAHKLTSVPGSSEYYWGSIVSYSYDVKTSELNVPSKMLEQFGAVSEETVKQMAIGVRERLHTDYSIAISGIAGPDGGTEEKPVGTVWIAVAKEDFVFAKKFQFGDNRERNILRSSISALAMLRKMMLGELDTE